jgi:hypothetical protein
MAAQPREVSMIRDRRFDDDNMALVHLGRKLQRDSFRQSSQQSR